jgi:hypothetical protein
LIIFVYCLFYFLLFLFPRLFFLGTTSRRWSSAVGDGDVHAVRAQRHGGNGHHARSLDKAH